MKQLLILIGTIIFLGCSKPEKDMGIVCIEPENWLSAKMKEYKACSCLTEIRKGTLDDMQVIWIGTIDPLCNGINILYKTDGTILVTSGDTKSYQYAMSRLTNVTTIWRCVK